MGLIEKGNTVNYNLYNNNNGVYAFVIDGAVSVNGEALETRDGLGISETDAFTATATDNSKVLLMEIPMK